MKSKNHQDPIQQLADRLREHAVPYREGAWEQFKAMEQKKKKPRLLWPYFSAAAAVMLLAITLFWPTNEVIIPVEVAAVKSFPEETPEFNKEELAQGKAPVQVLKGETHSDRVPRKRTASPQAKAQLAVVPAESSGQNKDSTPLSNVQAWEGKAVSLSMEDQQPVLNERTESTVLGLPEERLASSQAGENKPMASHTEKKNSTDFLAELLKIEEQEKAGLGVKSDRKWSVGLNVSPNMSANNHINIGGGVALAYTVSPKISISSGVSYLQLDAERGVSSQNQYSSPVSVEAGAVEINVNHKTLDKVQANLVGLDIPLTLNYHVNKRIFTSVGISVFSVLNESGSRQYLNEMAELAYGLGDRKTPEPIVRTFYSKEASSEKIYEGKSVSGFFNFSIGYSIPLSKKVGFAIEPFFKIPMGYLSPEELNLSNGGVKISTRF